MTKMNTMTLTFFDLEAKYHVIGHVCLTLLFKPTLYLVHNSFIVTSLEYYILENISHCLWPVEVKVQNRKMPFISQAIQDTHIICITKGYRLVDQ